MKTRQHCSIINKSIDLNHIFIKIFTKHKCYQQSHSLRHHTKFHDQCRIVHHDKAILTPLTIINKGGCNTPHPSTV